MFWLSQKFLKSVRSYSNLSLNVLGSHKVTLTFDLRLRSKVVEEKKTSSEVFGFDSTTNRIVAITFPKCPGFSHLIILSMKFLI